jgi:hypothetical protein
LQRITVDNDSCQLEDVANVQWFAKVHSPSAPSFTNIAMASSEAIVDAGPGAIHYPSSIDANVTSLATTVTTVWTNP